MIAHQPLRRQPSRVTSGMETRADMATTRPTQAIKRNVTKAGPGATARKTTAQLGQKTRPAPGKQPTLGKQTAGVAHRKPASGATPKTRAELYEIARRRDLPGRSKMSRDQLAKRLGER